MPSKAGCFHAFFPGMGAKIVSGPPRRAAKAAGCGVRVVQAGTRVMLERPEPHYAEVTENGIFFCGGGTNKPQLSWDAQFLSSPRKRGSRKSGKGV